MHGGRQGYACSIEILPDSVEPFKNISSKAYEHPADRAATAALKAIPMLDSVVRKLIEWRYERALRQFYLGTSVKVGEQQLPELWAAHRSVSHVLDMPEVYDLYVTSAVRGLAQTIGSEQPIIVLDAGFLRRLGPGEQRVVVAHELGHILSDHVVYITTLNILLSVGNPLPFFFGIPFRAVTAVLLEWYRATELSCDRASVLAVRDPEIVCRTLMATAGGMPTSDLNLDAFMAQALAYENWDDPSDRVRRFFNEIGQTHAYAVRRVSEVMKWVQQRRVRPDRPRRVPHARSGVQRPRGGERGVRLLRRALPAGLPRGRRQPHEPRQPGRRRRRAGRRLAARSRRRRQQRQRQLRRRLTRPRGRAADPARPAASRVPSGPQPNRRARSASARAPTCLTSDR